MIKIENGEATFEGKLSEVMTEMTNLMMDACELLVEKGIPDKGTALSHLEESVRFAWLVDSGMDEDEALKIISPEMYEMKMKTKGMKNEG